jgi:hypothetical protein
MHPTMRLYEDVLSSAQNVEFRLPCLVISVQGPLYLQKMG